jgi:RsiW-degrading membrane proteinase PrsW (M82 family)
MVSAYGATTLFTSQITPGMYSGFTWSNMMRGGKTLIDWDALRFALSFLWELYKTLIAVVSLVIYGAYVLFIIRDAIRHRKAMHEQRTAQRVIREVCEILEEYDAKNSSR